jgi:hypothetical protein
MHMLREWWFVHFICLGDKVLPAPIISYYAPKSPIIQHETQINSFCVPRHLNYESTIVKMKYSSPLKTILTAGTRTQPQNILPAKTQHKSNFWQISTRKKHTKLSKTSSFHWHHRSNEITKLINSTNTNIQKTQIIKQNTPAKL